MSSVKNRKKTSKGSGALARQEKKYENEVRVRDQECEDSDEKVAQRAKRKARKEVEAATTRDLNWVSALLNRIVALVFLGIILTRQDFGSAFGRGTGQNQAHLSPLAIVAWHVDENEFLKSNVKLRRALTKAITTIAIPAEAYNEYTRKPTAAEKKRLKKKRKGRAEETKGGFEVWKSNADAWVRKVSKDRGMSSVLRGNIFLGLGASGCVVFGLVAPLVPALGVNTLSAASVAGIFVGLNSSTNVGAKPTDMCFYALVLLVAGGVIGGLFESDPKKLAKLKRKRERAARQRQYVDAPSAEEMAEATSS